MSILIPPSELKHPSPPKVLLPGRREKLVKQRNYIRKWRAKRKALEDSR